MKSSYLRRARIALRQYDKEHPVLSGAIKIVDYVPPRGTYTPAPRAVRYEPAPGLVRYRPNHEDHEQVE